MSNLDRNEIDKKLIEICRGVMDVDLNVDDKDILSKNLLGNEIRMTSRDLVYLLFDIEEEFNIDVQEEDIISGKFHTLNNIRDVICRQLG